MSEDLQQKAKQTYANGVDLLNFWNQSKKEKTILVKVFKLLSELNFDLKGLIGADDVDVCYSCGQISVCEPRPVNEDGSDEDGVYPKAPLCLNCIDDS